MLFRAGRSMFAGAQSSIHKLYPLAGRDWQFSSLHVALSLNPKTHMDIAKNQVRGGLEEVLARTCATFIFHSKTFTDS